MATDSRRPKGLDGTVSALDAAIEGLNLAENSAVAPSVKAAFGSASLTLAMIKVRGFLLCEGASSWTFTFHH